MELTTQQEERLLLQYEGFIQGRVNEFRRNSTYRNPWDEEDLLQVARLEFLLHARECSGRSKLLACKKRIHRKLRAYVEAMSPVHIPHNLFLTVDKEITEVTLASVKELGVDEEESIPLLAICRDMVLESLPENCRQTYRLREAGYTLMESATILGLNTKDQVYRLLKKADMALSRLKDELSETDT